MSIKIPLYFKFLFLRFARTILLIFFSIFTMLLISELAFHFPFKNNQLMLFHLMAVFFKRLDLLFPISFLIGSIYLFCSLHKHNEITALNTSGISQAKIISPLFILSIISASLLYLNHQFILPSTNPWLLDEIKSKKESITSSEYEVRFLDDGSRIIYTISDMKLKDLFWIKSQSEIWHCEHIMFEEELPVGVYVDKMEKNDRHQFEKTGSYQKYALPNSFLSAKPKVEQKHELSITTLFKLLTRPNLSIAADKGYIYSLFCYKIINPLFSLLVITAIIPYILPYKRRYKQLNLYSISIVSFFVFHTLIKSCIILAEHYVISPLLTIILVPLLIQGVLSYRLWKIISARPLLQTTSTSKAVSSQPS